MTLKKLSFFVPVALVVSCAVFAEVTIKSSADEAPAKVGERVTFTISGLQDMEPVLNAQTVQNMHKHEKITIDRKGKDEVVRHFKVEAPGTFLLAVDLGKGFGKNYADSAFCSVMVAPEKVTPSGTAPKDLLKYWDGVKREMKNIPATPKLTRIDSEPGIELYEFEIAAGKGVLGSSAGVKAVGYMAKPEGAGPFPAVVTFYGAGSFEALKNDGIDYAKKGMIGWSVNPHPLANDLTQQQKDELKATLLKDYNQKGKDTKLEDVYFNGMFKRCYQVVQAIKQMPEWDGKILIARGFSQGGAQTIATAFLCPEVSHIAPQCPAMCDLTGNLVWRKGGWPFWVKSGYDKKEIETAGYFDMVNFAPHIKAKLFLFAGGIDGACPAGGVVAFYNQYAGPKDILILPDVAHARPNEVYKREAAFIMEAIGK